MNEVIVINPIQNNEVKRKRAAAYCRVSSDKNDQKSSFASQVEYYTSLICGNPEYELVDIYADSGITGTSRDKRDEFMRMINDCRKGKIDIILTKSATRFARNTLESLQTARELKTLGVTIIFENDGLNTETVTDEMLLTILSAKAQEESLSISGNMRWSYKKRMKKGEFITCSRPYGYRLVNNMLIIDEAEAETVRYIFDSYLSGKGKHAIANELTEQGKPKKNGDTLWHHSTVDTILRSEKYIGDSLLQKNITTDTLPFKSVRNTGQKEQIYLKNSHQPIISRRDYDNVQALLKARAEKFPQSKKRHEYPLRQKVICNECGSLFRRKIVNGIVCWICHTHGDNRSKCTMMPIPETDLYGAFIKCYNKLKRNCGKTLLPLLSNLSELKKRANAENTQIAEINKKLAELANQNLVLKDVTSKGYLDSDIFMQQSNDIKARMVKLRSEKQLLMRNDEDDETIAQTETVIKIIESGDEYITEFNPTLFSALADKIIVESRERIRIQLINGLKLTENIAR